MAEKSYVVHLFVGNKIRNRTSPSNKANIKGRGALVSPGAAARVRPSSTRLIRHQTYFPAIDIGAIQLVKGPLHVRMGAELNHSLVGAFLVGVCISHLSCLAHEVLEDKGRVFADKDGVTIIFTEVGKLLTTMTHNHQVNTGKQW